MKNNVFKNYLYNLIYQLFLIISPFITAHYLSKVLGADGIGMVSYADSIAIVFSLFASLGIKRFAQREISYNQNDIQSRSIVFWNIKFLSLITSFIILLIYIPFSLTRDNNILYFVMSINIFNVIVDISWLFQGMEDFKSIVLRNIIIKILVISLTFVFVKEKSDYIIYAILYVSAAFVSNLSLWISIRKYIIWPGIKNINPFHDIKTIISLFIPEVAIEVYTVLDKVMIGVITNNSYQNGYYEQAMRVSRLALTIVTALSVVMIPRISSLFKQGNTDEIKENIYNSYRFVWMLAIPICVGLFFVSENFIPWFFGADFALSIPLLKILSLLPICVGLSDTTGSQYLVPLKREKIFTKSVICGAVTNFVLNIIFISLFKSVGAAIASVIAEATVTAVQLYAIRKELDIKHIFSLSKTYILAVSVMAILLFVESRYLSSSVTNTLIMVASGASVYFVMLFILKDPLLNEIKNKFIKNK